MTCEIDLHARLPRRSLKLCGLRRARSVTFCSAAEPSTRYLLEPLHACVVYLVRLEP